MELSETAKRRVNLLRMGGLQTQIRNACPLCESEDVADRGAQVACRSCKAHTESYVFRLGEYQREMDAAAYDWNAGRVTAA